MVCLCFRLDAGVAISLPGSVTATSLADDDFLFLAATVSVEADALALAEGEALSSAGISSVCDAVEEGCDPKLSSFLAEPFFSGETFCSGEALPAVPADN